MMPQAHKTYLSVSSNQKGIRHYRCIRSGLPLCADSPTPDAAIASYLFCFRYEDDKPNQAPLYDGDVAEWGVLALC